ncbi:PREDICTED: uncharacterized protein LOC106819776 [Priapulus caudatus]|uniref:Uncharacterized protein LOC106819776 n=1 Tax=Priapulus caudatus TaxID=37621 RepID=A0ABM1F5X8_PRICU|nr:PREDICTED: uncharacterized protein LOC106819776 [Priapulus caudatus]
MSMSKQKRNSQDVAKNIYRETLDSVCKARYLNKLKVIAGIDPYEIEKGDWSKDISEWPEVTYPDIVNYLVFNQSAYTLQELKAYKSLESYNYFVSGWVLDIGHLIVSDKCVISGRVKHSQRMNDTCLVPWLICEKEGTVLSGHCTCMAGIGEVCSHVGALLFAVEAAVKIRNSRTVTEEKCYWLPSAVTKVQYKTIQEIDFTSAKMMKKQLDSVVSGSPVTPSAKPKKLPAVNEPTAAELSELFSALDASVRKPVLLALVPGFASKFKPKALNKKYPKVLSELYIENCGLVDNNTLTGQCDEVFRELSVRPEECENCENDTRGQSTSKQWFSFRAGRITASMVKAVCRTPLQNPSKSLIKNICYPGSKKFYSLQTQWGCDHESDAKKQYIETARTNHKNFVWRDSGLVIHPSYPYMGATPDGIGACDCCGEFVIEIKCPYCERNSAKISTAIDCLETHDGTLRLKRSHSYYYQVQCQLLMCNKKFCDFVVWTTRDFFCERIVIDSKFCHEMVEKSKNFFKSAVLPELVGKYFSNPLDSVPLAVCTNNSPDTMIDACQPNTQSVESVEVICVCKKVYKEGDDVIGCDNENCPYVWLHFKCVRIKRAPKGSWFCPECRKLPQYKKVKQ